jgi:hypothetical protein
MYNPEKQARAPGGKFGGKVATVVAEVETEVETAVQAGVKTFDEVAANVEASYKSINERINGTVHKPGEIVMVERPVADVSWGKIVLAIIGVALLAYVLFGR